MTERMTEIVMTSCREGWRGPAALAAVACSLVSQNVAAGDPGGRYAGRIACDALPGLTSKPLDAGFTMTVRDGKVDFERRVLKPDSRHPSGVVERGHGTVSADGDIMLSGSARGGNWRYESSYAGRFESGEPRLSGTQTWQLPDGVRQVRKCSIDRVRRTD